MDDVIDGLLRIKGIREDCREAEMHRAQNQLDLAIESLRTANDWQRKRDGERTEREDSLFRDVCSRSVKLRDLNELQSEIEIMKTDAKADAQSVVDAQTRRKERRQVLDDASLAWRLAAHAAQKFRDFAVQEFEQQAKYEEWRADLELEEYSGRGSLVAQVMEEEPQEA